MLFPRNALACAPQACFFPEKQKNEMRAGALWQLTKEAIRV
jgi:hypothetical protein